MHYSCLETTGYSIFLMHLIKYSSARTRRSYLTASTYLCSGAGQNLPLHGCWVWQAKLAEQTRKTLPLRIHYAGDPLTRPFLDAAIVVWGRWHQRSTLDRVDVLAFSKWPKTMYHWRLQYMYCTFAYFDVFKFYISDQATKISNPGNAAPLAAD